MNMILTILILLSLIPSYQNTEDLSGLWIVKEVLVNDEPMTPTAKWFQLYSNERVESGNGLTINMIGKWMYNFETSTLTFFDERGNQDPFGSFTVAFDPLDMKWTREEDGKKVVVHLEKGVNKPKAPWDKIQGFWLVTEAEIAGRNVTDSIHGFMNKVHLRWDRTYISKGANASTFPGYWHYDAHKPILTTMDKYQYNKFRHFQVDFINEKMLLTLQDSTQLEILLEPVNDF